MLSSGLLTLVFAVPVLMVLALLLAVGASGLMMVATPLILLTGVLPLFALSFPLAAFSRWRVNLWARDRGWRMPAVPLPRPRSWTDAFQLLANGRRWLDALFELVVAPVMRGSWLLALLLWTYFLMLGIVGIRASTQSPAVDPEHTVTYQLVLALRQLALRSPDPAGLSGTAADWQRADILLAGAGIFLLILALPVMLRLMALIEARVTVLALGDERGPISLHSDEPEEPAHSFSLTGWGAVQGLAAGTILVPVQLITTLIPLGGLFFTPDGPEAMLMLSELLALTATAALIAAVPASGWRPRLASVLLMVGLLIGFIAPIISYTATDGSADPWLESGPDSLVWPFGVGMAAALGAVLYQLFFAGRFRLGITVLTASTGTASLAVLVWWLLSRESVSDPLLVLGLTIAGALMLGGTGFLVNLFVTNQARLAEQRARSRAAERARAESEAARAESEAARAESEAARARSEAARTDLEERSRIARELHDVVAHSMSVISVQASTAQYRLPAKTASGDALDPAVGEEFDQIAATARQALGEMRGLLSLLRGAETAAVDGGGSAELTASAPAPLTAPQPGLTDLEALLERTRDAGVSVELEWCGDWADQVGADHGAGKGLAPTVQLVLYRAVQEGLSNALRHAPGSSVRVQLIRSAAPSTTDTAPPGAALQDPHEVVEAVVENGPASDPHAVPAPGAGLGLRGQRERAAALGGTVSAQPLPDGGYRLAVRLPI